MDKYTIFEQAGATSAVALASVESLADAARRDLEATLQLLAERAQYVTGASGASIALFEGREMVCRASAGRAAPEVGVEIETASGLIAEGIRSGQLVRCDNADSDARANRESCQHLGVKSAMLMPLLREQEVAGIFELVADHVAAFEDRDVAALARLAEMALIAVEHAEAAQRTLPEASEAESDRALPAKEPVAIAPAKPSRVERELSSTPAEPASAAAEIAQIGGCEACGFPVSQGRTLCVDCEQAGRSAESQPTRGYASGFSQLSAMGREESWLQGHSYTLGALFIAVLTIALLALKLR